MKNQFISIKKIDFVRWSIDHWYYKNKRIVNNKLCKQITYKNYKITDYLYEKTYSFIANKTHEIKN